VLWRVACPIRPKRAAIESQDLSQMVDRVLALPEGTRLYMWRRWCGAARAKYRKELAEYLRRDSSGQDRRHLPLKLAESAPTIDKKFPHDIEWWGKASWSSDIGSGWEESCETALKIDARTWR